MSDVDTQAVKFVPPFSQIVAASGPRTNFLFGLDYSGRVWVNTGDKWEKVSTEVKAPARAE